MSQYVQEKIVFSDKNLANALPHDNFVIITLKVAGAEVKQSTH